MAYFGATLGKVGAQGVGVGDDHGSAGAEQAPGTPGSLPPCRGSGRCSSRATWVLDAGDDPHRPTAGRAGLDVDVEHPFQALALRLIAARRSAGVGACGSARLPTRVLWVMDRDTVAVVGPGNAQYPVRLAESRPRSQPSATDRPPASASRVAGRFVLLDWQS